MSHTNTLTLSDSSIFCLQKHKTKHSKYTKTHTADSQRPVATLTHHDEDACSDQNQQQEHDRRQNQHGDLLNEQGSIKMSHINFCLSDPKDPHKYTSFDDFNQLILQGAGTSVCSSGEHRSSCVELISALSCQCSF